MADSVEPQVAAKLPENAYRELRPGETYVPMVPPEVTVPEITTRSIIFGIVMNIVFAMAATYLALKVGQGIETAIPISILAVGLSGFLLKMGYRHSSFLENVNILAIGTTSGIVCGGTVFTMPAIYVLKLHQSLEMSSTALFFQIFIVPFLGAVLGVLFLVPFRRYFVRDMHGKLPFPEATATNEILVAGSSGGAQAWVLIYAFVVGAVYNWIAGAFKLFTEVFTTAAIPALSKFTDNVKAVFSLGTGAEFMGLGFIIGVRYASIICAGSFLSWFVIIPLLAPLDLDQMQALNPAAEAHHGPQEPEPRFTMASTFEDEFDSGGAMSAQLALRKEFKKNEVLLAIDVRIGVEKVGDEWKLTAAEQTFTLKQAGESKFNLASSFKEGLDKLAQMSGTEDEEREELRKRLKEEFANSGCELEESKPGVHIVQAGRMWNVTDGDRRYRITTTKADLSVEEMLVAVYGADETKPLFNMPAGFAIHLDELDRQRPFLQAVREKFAEKNSELSDVANVILLNSGFEWRVTDKEHVYRLKRTVTEVDIYFGEETEPRFNLTMDPGSKLDTLDKAGTLHLELNTALTEKNIVVEYNAEVSVVERGSEWKVISAEQTYVLKATQIAIAGYVDGERKPSFTIAIAFGKTLDEFDKRPTFVESVRGEFARNGIDLYDGANVAVEDSGNKWKAKGEKQSFVAQLDEEENNITITALLPGADDLFLPVPRNIGIGCIFTAGLLSILKMSKVIWLALTQALGGLFKSKVRSTKLDRTDEDINYPTLLVIGIITAVAIWFYFRFVVLVDMPNATTLSIVSLVLAIVIAFIFTTVSAWAIAMISVTPISGMTVTTIIITAVALLACGLPKGDGGMLAVLLVGGVVATALSMAGTLVTEFKIGFWLGASPKKICWSAIVAALLASVCVTGTIMVLEGAYGYDPKVSSDALQAPQANMMASALKSFIGVGAVPWVMYGTGVMMALLLQLVGVSPLAFGLGMYLPMELNAPILAGALVALLVKKSSKDEAVSKARSSKGILIASGLIAGAAIMGVFKSILVLTTPDTLDAVDISNWLGTESAINWYGLIAFLLLAAFVYFDCRRAKVEEGAPEIHM